MNGVLHSRLDPSLQRTVVRIFDHCSAHSGHSSETRGSSGIYTGTNDYPRIVIPIVWHDHGSRKDNVRWHRAIGCILFDVKRFALVVEIHPRDGTLTVGIRVSGYIGSVLSLPDGADPDGALLIWNKENLYEDAIVPFPIDEPRYQWSRQCSPSDSRLHHCSDSTGAHTSMAFRYCRRTGSADPRSSSDHFHCPSEIHRSTRSTGHKRFHLRSFAYPNTHDDDLDVTGRSAIARRVQIQIQTNGHFG